MLEKRTVQVSCAGASVGLRALRRENRYVVDGVGVWRRPCVRACTEGRAHLLLCTAPAVSSPSCFREESPCSRARTNWKCSISFTGYAACLRCRGGGGAAHRVFVLFCASLLTDTAQVCGVPDESTWPGVSELPWFSQFQPMNRKDRPRILASKFAARCESPCPRPWHQQPPVASCARSTPAAVDLLDRLLSLDPARRPTAEEVRSGPARRALWVGLRLTGACDPRVRRSTMRTSASRPRRFGAKSERACRTTASCGPGASVTKRYTGIPATRRTTTCTRPNGGARAWTVSRPAPPARCPRACRKSGARVVVRAQPS